MKTLQNKKKTMKKSKTATTTQVVQIQLRQLHGPSQRNLIYLIISYSSLQYLGARPILR